MDSSGAAGNGTEMEMIENGKIVNVVAWEGIDGVYLMDTNNKFVVGKIPAGDPIVVLGFRIFQKVVGHVNPSDYLKTQYGAKTTTTYRDIPQYYVSTSAGLGWVQVKNVDISLV